jgi:hypothetical protein
MQPLCYPTLSSQVGLVGTLLSGTTLAWFSLLLENYSPLLNDFEGLLENFTAYFGEVDKRKIANFKYKIYAKHHDQLQSTLQNLDTCLVM